MSALFENIVELPLVTKNWVLVQPFEDKTLRLTVKNRSDTAVSVFCTTAELELADIDAYLEQEGINPPEVGGCFFEVSSKTSEKMYVKCPSGKGKISVRIFGTVDPTEDLTALAQVVSELRLEHDKHVETVTGNPHKVTKAEVGLGSIPNKITSNIDDPKYPAAKDTDVIATLAMVRGVKAYASEHINITSGNPHGTTKAHVGLGKVANYPPATDAQALDITNNTTLLTPRTGNLLVKDIVVVASSMRPQMVIAGATRTRPSGWTMYDISAPADYIVKDDNRSILIKKGLQVSYAYRGMCRVSKVLDENMYGKWSDNMKNGIHYVYVDLDSKGNISSWGTTQFQPRTLPSIEAVDGDYYNYALCEMRHANGVEVSRVYIGKALFTNNEVVEIIPVPIGESVTIPVTTTLTLGKSAQLTNPFCIPTKTVAHVEYNQRWGETGWNDQTGVTANPKPGAELDQILVQIGSVGYLTKGSSAGNSFGSEFMTITEAMRMVVRIDRVH